MGKITVSQLFAIFLLSTGLNNHVIVIPILIDADGRDAWISILISYAFIILLLPLLLFITKKLQTKSLFEWLTLHYSEWLSKFIAIIISCFLLLAGWVTIKETVLWTNETYLFRTPIIFIALLLLASSFYIAYGKLNVIAICAGILLPLVILFGIFVFIATIPEKNYNLIAPVLVENNWQDVFLGAFFSFGSLTELLLIILLQHQVTKTIKPKHFIVLITFLIILTIGPLLDTIAIFGVEEASTMRYPTFFQWRIVGIGNYFNHLDFLAIYQWLSSTCIRLALILYLITHALNMKDNKKRIWVQASICSIYIISVLVPISDEAFLSFLANYYYLGSSIFGVAFVLIIMLFIKFSRKEAVTSAKIF